MNGKPETKTAAPGSTASRTPGPRRATPARGSTAKVAPTTSFRPSVRSFTMFMLPVMGGMGPSTV